MLKKYINRQRIFKSFQQNSWLFASVLLLLQGCNSNCNIASDIEVSPFKFTMFERKDSIISDFKKLGFSFYHDDSYYLMDKGVSYFEFGLEKDSVRYFVELFFISEELNGVRILFYNAVSPTALRRKVNSDVLPSFRSSVRQNDCIVIDTTWNDNQKEYSLFFRSKKLNRKMN